MGAVIASEAKQSVAKSKTMRRVIPGFVVALWLVATFTSAAGPIRVMLLDGDNNQKLARHLERHEEGS